MNYRRKPLTSALAPLVELGLLKKQCRVDDDTEDDLIDAAHESAVVWLEDYCLRALRVQSFQASLCGFPWALELPYAAPLGAVTFVKYYDASNVLQTLSTSVYTVPEYSEPARIKLAYGQVWPTLYQRDDAVQIEYTAGYASGACPAALIQAVLLLTEHAFANRGVVVVGTIAQELPLTVRDLCAPYRLFAKRPQWAA